MKWDQIEGKWMQLQGSVRQYWPVLTEEDIHYIAGSRDKLEAKLRERYAIAPAESKTRVDAWLKTMDKGEGVSAGSHQRPPARQETEHAGKR